MLLPRSIILAAIVLVYPHSAVDGRIVISSSIKPISLSSRRVISHGRREAKVAALSLRGGATKEEEDDEPKGNGLTRALNSVTPTTRVFLIGCLVMATLTLLGVPEELFLFEAQRTFLGGQLWRPFTSACHLGKVDMGMASQLYFLLNYGQEMERQDGSAQQAMFLLVQVVLLMGISTLIGYPSFARSLITAAIYCCSRREPSRPMEVQFGVRIEYWLLPYVNLVVDCLQAQSPAGAVPHVLGILTGHVYHFFSMVWPKMGGRRYLSAPGILKGAAAPKADKKQPDKKAAKKGAAASPSPAPKPKAKKEAAAPAAKPALKSKAKKAGGSKKEKSGAKKAKKTKK